MKIKILFLFAICSSKLAFGQCRIDYQNYIPVIDEHFDTYSGNINNMTSLWKLTPTDNSNGYGTSSEIYYPQQLTLIQDGVDPVTNQPIHHLRMTAEPFEVPVQVGDKKYYYKSGGICFKQGFQGDPVTSSCVVGSRGYAYGLFEVRCKIPKGDPNQEDAWPAFWLISPPSEIDIFDNSAKDPSKFLFCGFVDWTNQPEWNNSTKWHDDGPCNGCPYPKWDREVEYHTGDKVVAEINGVIHQYTALFNMPKAAIGHYSNSVFSNMDDDYHIYTLAWTPTEITIFFDGREVVTMDPHVYGHQLADCPMNLRLNLQTQGGSNYPLMEMDVDYIRVYKPRVSGVYGPYKHAEEWMNTDLFKDVAIGSPGDRVSKDFGSITAPQNDPNLVYHKGEDGKLYESTRQTFGEWQMSSIPFEYDNIPPTSLIASDIIYRDQAIYYRGVDNRLQLLAKAYVTNEWYHWHLDDNWSTDDFLVNDKPGSMSLGYNSMFYIGKADKKIHSYTNWTIHDWVAPSHTYTTNEYAFGDIVTQTDANNNDNIVYKGVDNRLQGFFWDQTANDYTHSWLTSTSNPSSTVSTTPGSVTFGSMNELFYVGTNGVIHRIHLNNGSWQFDNFFENYTYGNPLLVYSNGDRARSGISYDVNNNRVIYFGYDGRLQYFGNIGTGWYHGWIDDYWNTNQFATFEYYANVTHPNYSPSLFCNAAGNFFYCGDIDYLTYDLANPCCRFEPPYVLADEHQHLRCFSYGECTNLVDGVSSYSNMSRVAQSQNKTLDSRSELHKTEFIKPLFEYQNKVNKNFGVTPNPSSDGIFEVSGASTLTVTDLTGKIIVKVSDLPNERYKLDLSTYAKGVYILSAVSEKSVHTQKIFYR